MRPCSPRLRRRGDADRGCGHQPAGGSGRDRATPSGREGASGKGPGGRVRDRWHAFAIGNAGDGVTHDRMVGEVALRIADTVDVLCLAQVSMALARTEDQAMVTVPVVTNPESADARLKALLSE